jgi:hypothetical protein
VGGGDLIVSLFLVIVGIGGKHAFLPERMERRLFISFLFDSHEEIAQ